MKWYEEIEIDGEILQGDIVMSCPVLITNVVDKTKGLNELLESEEGLLETEIQFMDVVVMTQSCDMSNGELPEMITVCPFESLVGESKELLGNLRTNKMPEYHLISDKKEGQVKFDFSYVIFSEVYQVNTHLLLEAIRKQEKRVIMNSPYREWLSQRFGNYYARVGLPYAIGKKELYEACYKEASR